MTKGWHVKNCNYTLKYTHGRGIIIHPTGCISWYISYYLGKTIVESWYSPLLCTKSNPTLSLSLLSSTNLKRGSLTVDRPFQKWPVLFNIFNSTAYLVPPKVSTMQPLNGSGFLTLTCRDAHPSHTGPPHSQGHWMLVTGKTEHHHVKQQTFQFQMLQKVAFLPELIKLACTPE